jgi:hypothetical protein
MANGFSSLQRTPTLAGAKTVDMSLLLIGSKPLETAPVLIIENPLPSCHQLPSSVLQLGTKTTPGLKFCPGRLKHVESIDVIFTDDDQGYFAGSLDRAHYHLSRVEYQEFCCKVGQLSNILRRKIPVNEFPRGENNFGPNCNVVNRLSPEMKECFETVDFASLGAYVKTHSKCDSSRGNLYIDSGWASNLSSRRVKGEDYGVSKPAEITVDPPGKEIFADAMVSLSKFALLICPHSMKEKLYQADKRRQLEFADKHVEGNLLEVMRVALTNEKYLVGCHADKYNDVLDWNEGVVNFSTWIVIDGEWWRLSLIGYSRKSISDYYRRLDLYGPLVDRISLFMDALPSDRVEIEPSLLDFRNTTGHVKRLKPHANKCVFYSSYVECCHLLQAKLNLTKWHLFGLLVNVTSSETPDYMWLVTQEILASDKLQQEAMQLGPVELGVYFYEKIFDKKEAVSAAKLPVAGQRHQPHNNVRQPGHKIEASILNLIKLHHGLNLLDSRLCSDIHYFCRAIAYLEQGWEKKGVYGAGALTAQHIFGVGVLLGLYPREMLQHALVAEGGNAYKYLAKKEGLQDHIRDTYQLLANGSCYLGISWFVMENVVCKWTQFEGGTDKTAVDSVYSGQSIYYMDDDNRLVQVTMEGISRGVLPCTCRCRQSSTLDSTIGVPSPSLDHSFWTHRLFGKQKTFPLKSATREYLRDFLLGDAVAPQVGTAAKSTKRDREPVQSKLVMNKKRRSAVVTGSVVVPGVPNQHRLVMEQSRHPFDMGVLAREALSIPSQTKLKTIMVTKRKHRRNADNQTVCYLSVSIQIGNGLPPWCPPSHVTVLLAGSSGTFVDEEDTRWFLNKKDATRYTLLCAALVGNKNYTSNVLVPRYLATAIGEDTAIGEETVVLYDPMGNKHGARRGLKVLFGAITCVGTRLAYFHLVDDCGKTYSPDGGLEIRL